jgi:hypothetical protein
MSPLHTVQEQNLVTALRQHSWLVNSKGLFVTSTQLVVCLERTLLQHIVTLLQKSLLTPKTVIFCETMQVTIIKSDYTEQIYDKDKSQLGVCNIGNSNEVCPDEAMARL